MSDENDGVSAEEAADIARASEAGGHDKREGTHDPDNKLSSDTPEQVDAYEQAHKRA